MSGSPLDLTLPAGPFVLSPPAERDLDDLVAACQDPDIQRFTRVPRPYTLEHARGFLQMCEEGAREGSQLGLVARDRDGRLLASCGLVSIDAMDRVGEVGYWVAPWARRQGVATEATRAVARYAFGELGLERLQLEAATSNPGSNEVARRTGFVLEGTLRRHASDRDPAATEHRRFDMNVWGLLPDELV